MAVELCLLLLLFCGSTISEVQPIYKPPPGTLDFGFVPSKTYDTGAYHEPGAIGILFKIVHAFLYLVQPNTFPQGKRINYFCLKYSFVIDVVILICYIDTPYHRYQGHNQEVKHMKGFVGSMCYSLEICTVLYKNIFLLSIMGRRLLMKMKCW